MVSVLIKESDLGFRYWLVLLGKALHACSAHLYPGVKSMGATCTGICTLVHHIYMLVNYQDNQTIIYFLELLNLR